MSTTLGELQALAPLRGSETLPPLQAAGGLLLGWLALLLQETAHKLDELLDDTLLGGACLLDEGLEAGYWVSGRHRHLSEAATPSLALLGLMEVHVGNLTALQ